MRTIVLDRPIMPTVDAGPDQEVPDYSSSLIILSVQEIITSEGNFIDPNFILVNQTIVDSQTFDNFGLSVEITNVDVVNPHNFAFEATIGLSLTAIGSWTVEFLPNSPATFSTTSVSHSFSLNSYELDAHIYGDSEISQSTVAGASGGPADNSNNSYGAFSITDETKFFTLRILIGVDDLSPGSIESAFAATRLIFTKL